MSVEMNKALVRRLFEEVYNQKNYQVADELIAEHYISHSGMDTEVFGPEGIKKSAALQHAAFPDLQTTIEDLIAEGDKVVVRGTDRGTFKGGFMNYEPTGRSFTITWIDIFRIENGKLVEAWLEIDTDKFRQEIGLSAPR